jgi:hypothetical protein
MNVMRNLFSIVAVLALVILLFISVESRRLGGESCQCFLVGECQFDEQGTGYRYRMCGGACAAYSSWIVDMRCARPIVKTLPESAP